MLGVQGHITGRFPSCYIFSLPEVVELLITSHSEDTNTFQLPLKMRTMRLRC